MVTLAAFLWQAVSPSNILNNNEIIILQQAYVRCHTKTDTVMVTILRAVKWVIFHGYSMIIIVVALSMNIFVLQLTHPASIVSQLRNK